MIVPVSKIVEDIMEMCCYCLYRIVRENVQHLPGRSWLVPKEVSSLGPNFPF